MHHMLLIVFNSKIKNWMYTQKGTSYMYNIYLTVIACVHVLVL